MRYLIVLPGGLMIALIGGCGKSQQPESFNPGDAQQTARWAGELLKPLNSTPAGMNVIARNDALADKMLSIKAKIEPMVGQAVSWEMSCVVSEVFVALDPHGYGHDGKPMMFDRESNPFALMVLDDRPKKDSSGRPLWNDNPDLRSFIIAIPERISRAEAAKLTDRVTVNARIQEIEIGKYQDKNRNERFLLYVYLTGLKLKPVVK